MIDFPLEAPRRTETGWSVTARLAEDSPFLRGHFPGRPILPAVAQLALVSQAASAAFDRELWPAAVRDVRFQRPLVPECEVEVRLPEALGDGDVRFAVLTGGKPAGRGALSLAPAERVAERSGHTTPAADASVGIHLPQVGEARYVHAVVSADEGGLTCLARVPEGNAFRSGGKVVPAFLGLEIGAQAAATHEGVLREREGGAARAVQGFVVRCRDAEFESLALPADEELVVTARLVEAAPPLRTYAIEVEGVRASVSTFAGN